MCFENVTALHRDCDGAFIKSKEIREDKFRRLHNTGITGQTRFSLQDYLKRNRIPQNDLLFYCHSIRLAGYFHN